MSDAAAIYEAGDYLDRSFTAKGVGGWRRLYLGFIEDLAPYAVIELGAGAPEFLDQVEASRRVAVDVGQRFAEDFRSRGIEFACRDLEKDALEDLGPVDVAICSDVFEHLINPAAALDRIAGLMGDHGVLFSHVPNEYRLGHVVKVMLNRKESVQFHGGATEWEDPHFRRFSDIGYRNFLSRRFAHNLKLSDLRYGRSARLLRALGLGVPYCLQGGPTYASTNNPAIFERLCEIKAGRKSRG
jgi:SAM-dependent methyltransferase